MLKGYDELPKPLDAEMEEYLIKQCMKGDEEARGKLIEHNLRLVLFIANKYRNGRTDLEDLTSMGTIGLIKAINTFKPDKNIKLATYASRCIENEMLMFFRRNKKAQHDVSLQETFNSDSDGNDLSIADTIGGSPDEVEGTLEKKQDLTLLKVLLNDLPEEEKNIIKFRYGIDCEKKKQSDIAKIFDISQSYISRIERRILLKLKNEFENAVS